MYIDTDARLSSAPLSCLGRHILCELQNLNLTNRVLLPQTVLFHEDNGMMTIVDIVDENAQASSDATQHAMAPMQM